MAGHSKWANIKHRKGSQDAKRGQIFTRLSKEITVSAKLGGGDENSNPRLKAAVQKARQANMPKDNIEKAIKKGTGELEGVSYEEAVYEGYGNDGIAIMVEIMTDKKSRTLPEIKNIFSKAGGSLAESGAVEYLFTHTGTILIKSDGVNEEELLEAIMQAEATDFEKDDDVYLIKTEKENFHKVLNHLEPVIEAKGWELIESGLRYLPQATIELEKEKALAAMKLIDTLENHEDVQNVYSNLELGDWALDYDSE